MIVRDGQCYPIDFANATPDMAMISLHYYFPWAVTALAKWSLYCAVTGRAMRLDKEIGRWYAVADDPRPVLGGEAGRLPGPGRRLLRGRPLRRVLRQHLAHAEDCMAEYVESPEFDAHLVATIQRAFPPHEHEQFVAHYRGLLGAWVTDQRAAAS